MLYCIRMEVKLPEHMPPAELEQLKAREKARAVELQQQGKFVHLWRVVGQYANISIFDCDSNDELHELLSSLPMFPYFRMEVIPLARHPSSIK